MEAMTDVDQTAKARFAGKLIFCGEDEYERARTETIFHTRHPARYPAAVLRAKTENDIVEGVRLAKERGWKVALRSGGHSFPVWSLHDDGLMIDLVEYKEMSYNAETHIVSVTPAIHGGDELSPYLRQFDRFFTGGGCPSVAVGGFLLQGGMGWNFRGWGYAAENIVAIDVVTADGELVRADDTQNSDLYWAARGAGPGFCGAITRFYLKTLPMPKALTSTMQLYPVESFRDVLPWLLEAHKRIPNSVHLLSGSFIPKFPVPNHDGGNVFYVQGLAFCDTPEEARAALQPLSECPFLGDALLVLADQPTSLAEQYVLGDSAHPKGMKYRVDSCWVDGPHEEIVEASRALLSGRPDGDVGHTFFQFPLPHEAPDMAMSLVTECMMGAYVIYDTNDDDDKYRDFLQSAMEALQPYTVGQYWGDSDQQFREVKCLTDDAFARLEKIRQARDPSGVFADYLAKPTGFRNINEWEQ